VSGTDPLIGQTISHYRIVERIGSGGMGVVYLAHDKHLDREVAVKVLPLGTLAHDSARRRFRNEALSFSKLNHPNIATIHDFDTQQSLDFLVMEYIPGVTLNDKLKEASLPEKQVIALGTQLAEGLSATHEQYVVHRDLKPGNLRLTTNGRLKILDFGVAKLLTSAVADQPQLPAPPARAVTH
jgi:serine/threonine protein kinase